MTYRISLDIDAERLSPDTLADLRDAIGSVAQMLIPGARDWEISDGPVVEPAARPQIVCICGSTRFRDELRAATTEETLAGRIVLAIGLNLRDEDPRWANPTVRDELKIRMDDLHKRRIDLADEVLVISDESGYFGDSTRSEIEYALAQRKPVRFVHRAAQERWNEIAAQETR